MVLLQHLFALLQVEKSDEKVQSLALLMLHYCSGLQHCVQEQETQQSALLPGASASGSEEQSLDVEDDESDDSQYFEEEDERQLLETVREIASADLDGTEEGKGQIAQTLATLLNDLNTESMKATSSDIELGEMKRSTGLTSIQERMFDDEIQDNFASTKGTQKSGETDKESSGFHRKSADTGEGQTIQVDHQWNRNIQSESSKPDGKQQSEIYEATLQSDTMSHSARKSDQPKNESELEMVQQKEKPVDTADVPNPRPNDSSNVNNNVTGPFTVVDDNTESQTFSLPDNSLDRSEIPFDEQLNVSADAADKRSDPAKIPSQNQPGASEDAEDKQPNLSTDVQDIENYAEDLSKKVFEDSLSSSLGEICANEEDTNTEKVTADQSKQ